VLASVLPTLWGWQVWTTLLIMALGLGLWAWSHAPRPTAGPVDSPAHPRGHLNRPWQVQAFRRLIAVFVVSGSASAIPATLVLFFINDRLAAPQWQGGFLALYFVAAAASMPLWLRAVKRWGLVRAWLLGMVASVLVFAWAASLGSGDVMAFAVVCALSGMALGADLSLPSALLATVVERAGDQEHDAGTYFGWWNLATKWNLALAAGVTLPVLSLLGYEPGATDEHALMALSAVYAVLPCALKALAAGLVWRWLTPLALTPSSTTVACATTITR
jgi:glycoside/pentoside/hexuronide:cation symporter, GPH family